jgi:ABC-2 type transport system permease protein
MIFAIWGAVIFVRGGLVVGGLVVLLAGCCFGYPFFHLSAKPIPLTADRILWAALMVQCVVWWRLGRTDPKRPRSVEFVMTAFFGILILYVANMKGESATWDRELWQLFITILNLTASLLILATLTTRFVFPLISLEGKRFWILGLAPVTLREIVMQKLVLSVGTTSIFTVGLICLSSWRLGLSGGELAMALYTITTATIALSGLAVGLGCLYPNFEEDNPARIVSGMGGTLTFVLSLIYVILVVVSHGLALHGLRSGAASWAIVVWLLSVALLGSAAFFLPLRLGLSHLEKVEI